MKETLAMYDRTRLIKCLAAFSIVILPAGLLWMVLSQVEVTQNIILSMVGGVGVGLILSWLSSSQWDALNYSIEQPPPSPQLIQRSLIVVILAPSILNALFSGTSAVPVIMIGLVTPPLVMCTYFFLSLLLAPIWYRHVQTRDPRDS